MLGQLLDPFAPRDVAGIVFAGVVVALAVAEEVDVAALAIAAPVPASKPVAARVATRGLIGTMFDSPPFIAFAGSSPTRL